MYHLRWIIWLFYCEWSSLCAVAKMVTPPFRFVATSYARHGSTSMSAVHAARSSPSRKYGQPPQPTRCPSEFPEWKIRRFWYTVQVLPRRAEAVRHWHCQYVSCRGSYPLLGTGSWSVDIRGRCSTSSWRMGWPMCLIRLSSWSSTSTKSSATQRLVAICCIVVSHPRQT